MQVLVTDWIDQGGPVSGGAAGTPAEGMGFGAELFTGIDVSHCVIEALLTTFLHIGLSGAFNQVRHWRSKRPADVAEVGKLLDHRDVLVDALAERIRHMGPEAAEARRLAEASVQALTDKATNPADPPTP